MKIYNFQTIEFNLNKSAGACGKNPSMSFCFLLKYCFRFSEKMGFHRQRKPVNVFLYFFV
jgi:hypothetical protein